MHTLGKSNHWHFYSRMGQPKKLPKYQDFFSKKIVPKTVQK